MVLVEEVEAGEVLRKMRRKLTTSCKKECFVQRVRRIP